MISVDSDLIHADEIENPIKKAAFAVLNWGIPNYSSSCFGEYIVLFITSNGWDWVHDARSRIVPIGQPNL
jgi:hypothetical protein